MNSRGDVLSHHQMCAIEGKMLQQGMNFRSSESHSVVLMSRRPNAPYPDRFSVDGRSLHYIGHDAYGVPNKTEIDQPLVTNHQTLTPNGKFFKAVADANSGAPQERVRVYEKLKPGVWVFNGTFRLTEAHLVSAGGRLVCEFTLVLDDESEAPLQVAQSLSPGRLIPTEVKLLVWKRDGGRCVQCGTSENLHFDHILPFSLGGTSVNADNIQLLCQKHNLEKSARII